MTIREKPVTFSELLQQRALNPDRRALMDMLANRGMVSREPAVVAKTADEEPSVEDQRRAAHGMAPMKQPAPKYWAKTDSFSDYLDNTSMDELEDLFRTTTDKKTPVLPEEFLGAYEVSQSLPEMKQAKSEYAKLRDMLSKRQESVTLPGTSAAAIYRLADTWGPHLGANSNMLANYSPPTPYTDSPGKDRLDAQKESLAAALKLAKEAREGTYAAFLNREKIDELIKNRTSDTSKSGSKDETKNEVGSGNKDGKGSNAAGAEERYTKWFEHKFAEPYTNSLLEMDKAKALMDTDTTLGESMIKISMARIAGEKGALSDRDITRISPELSVQQKVRAAWDAAWDGKLSKESKREYVMVLEALRAIAERKYEETAEAVAETNASAFGIPKARAIEITLRKNKSSKPQSLMDEFKEYQKNKGKK